MKHVLVLERWCKCFLHGATTWKGKWFCEVANQKIEQMQDEQVNCQKFALKIVLKFLYLARIGRVDILLTVNKLVRATTTKTRACDKRLATLIPCIHHTSTFRQHCHVGNNTVNPRHEDFFCICPISWSCKKQTSVSNSTGEVELVSLDGVHEYVVSQHRF